jgi:hypothetical protein
MSRFVNGEFSSSIEFLSDGALIVKEEILLSEIYRKSFDFNSTTNSELTELSTSLLQLSFDNLAGTSI